MKNSKITRLMLGLVILFGFFIFQGSDTSDGACTNCVQSDLVGLRISNKSDTDLYITSGDYSKENDFERETWLAKGSSILFTWRVDETLRVIQLKIAAWRVDSSGKIDDFHSLKRLNISGTDNEVTFR